MKLIVLISLLFSTKILAGDIKLGEKIFKKKNCKQCHNKDGSGKAKLKKGKYKLSIMKGPGISGLSVEYIKAQVAAIQKKKRTSKYLKLMQKRVEKLTATQIDHIAAYVNSLSKTRRKGILEK